MPSDLQRVMIAFDARESERAPMALDRAAAVQHGAGAVLVVQVCYDRLADESVEVLPAAERDRLIRALTAADEHALAELTAPWRGRLANLETRSLWSRDGAAAITETALRWPAQLLIKPASAPHPAADFFHAPLERALMGRAPCPLMIVRTSSRRPGGRVLAAVDAADEDHDALNREIVRRASILARSLDAELHLVSSYPDLGRVVDRLAIGGELEAVEDEMKRSRSRRLTALLDATGVGPAELHLLPGDPADVIPALADELGAELTVVGTLARRGVARMVLGNTAEALIGRLQGDLMTVRAPWS